MIYCRAVLTSAMTKRSRKSREVTNQDIVFTRKRLWTLYDTQVFRNLAWISATPEWEKSWRSKIARHKFDMPTTVEEQNLGRTAYRRLLALRKVNATMTKFLPATRLVKHIFWEALDYRT